MTVYVSNGKSGRRARLWSDDTAELIVFCHEIGHWAGPNWLTVSPTIPVSVSRRVLALAHGAVPVSNKELVKLMLAARGKGGEDDA